MAVRNITDLSSGIPICDEDTLLNYQTRSISSSGGSNELGREVIFSIHDIEPEKVGFARLFFEIEFILKTGYAPSDDDVNNMSVWHFLDEYRISTPEGLVLADCRSDEVSKITQHVLDNTKFNVQNKLKYTADNLPRVVLVGMIPLPSNLINVRRLNFKPDPTIIIRFKTIDLNITKRTDRDITKSVALAENTKHSMSRITIHDRLAVFDNISADDDMLMPNLLRCVEREYTINAGIKLRPLSLDLGDGRYPQAIWLIEPKDETDAAATPTLTGKLSASINNVVIYSVENLDCKTRFDWKKGVDDKWIHYLGPINYGRKGTSLVRFDSKISKTGNSGSIVINITKTQNKTGKYKLLVVYYTRAR